MKYETQPLGKYINIISGYAFKSKDYKATGIPIIKIKNVTPPEVSLDDLSYIPLEIANSLPKFELSCGDVLIALTGSHINQMASVVGRVARVKYYTRSMLNQRVGKIVVTDTDACDLDFVYYFLSQDQVKISLASKAGGAANQANISPSDVKELQIPFPSIDTQRHIAHILLSYDNLIENNKKQIKLSEEAAMRLYKEWFVNLRFPGHEKTPVVDGVPEGWARQRFYNVFSFERGKSYASNELSGKGGVILVNLKNVSAYGGYRRNVEKRFTGTYKANHKVLAGDVIMAITDMTQERRLVGYVARIPNLKDIAIISMDLVKLIPYEVSNSYLYSTLRFSDFGNAISQYANGVNVLHLKPDSIMNFEMFVPQESLLNKYDEVIEEYFQRIEILEDENEKLAHIRDALLPKLIYGDVKL